MRTTRKHLAGLAVAFLASPTLAQCDPAWDVTLGNPGISRGYIEPIYAWDDGSGEKLFVGGSAENIGGDPRNDFLAQYDPATGTWSRVGDGIQRGNTNAFLTRLRAWDDGTGEKLFVTGFFAGAGNIPGTKSLAAWDGQQWHALGSDFPSNSANATYDAYPADLGDGEKLYICGNFEEIAGIPAGRIAAWDGQSFSPVGTGSGFFGSFSPFVQSLIAWDDGSGLKLYACGRFDGVDGITTRNVARYNPQTGEWEAFGQRLIPESATANFTAWAVFDDGRGPALYVSGQRFRIQGDPNVYLVARWDGTRWEGVGQELSGRATDLMVFDDGNGPALYVTGTAMFEVNYFARLVDGLWEPAESGVNNPPVEGNFSSAFGLGLWDDNLVVGGNFSQVGGLDPVTGVGEGDPIPARGIAMLTPCTTTCPADLDGDGDADSDDFFLFLDAFAQGDAGTCDLVGDGDCDADDFFAYLDLFSVVCP